MDRLFWLSVNDDIFKERDITKKQYKMISQWQRTVCRTLHNKFDIDKAFQEAMNIVLFGKLKHSQEI